MNTTRFLLLLFVTIGQWAAAECQQPSACDAFSYATAANDVYHDHSPHPIGCSGHPANSSESGGAGFYAEVYGDPQNGFVIAFRGTQETQDWIDDFLQGLNGNQQLNEQFKETADYMAHVMDALNNCYPPGTKKTIVGHSLGGALAQYAATLAGDGYQTVTYNPAGLLPDSADPANAKCVYNYVHGNDILKQLVNPLLKRLKDNGCSDVSSGYVGTDVQLTDEKPKYDFSKVNVPCSDLAKLKDLLEELNQDLPNWAQSGLGQTAWGISKLPQILGVVSKMQSLGSVFEAISPDASASWKSLCDEYNTAMPSTIPAWDLIAKAKWEKDHIAKMVAGAQDFWGKLQNAAGDVGGSGGDHLLGEIKDQPGHYKPGSVLGLLQSQCNQSGGAQGGGTQGGGTQGGGGPTIYGGYPTVPGGCFGNQPLTDGMPSDFLSLLGQMVDAAGSQSTQDVLGNASGALDVLDQFTGLAQKLNMPGASTLTGLGKYTGPLGEVIQILSIGGQLTALGNGCLTALASGSEQDFVNAINTAAKSAVSTITGALGSAGGTALGGAGGTAIGGPIGTFLGGVAGGWLGGLAGEAAGNLLYDQLMKDWVTKNIAEPLFNLLCPQSGAGGGGTAMPPSNPPGADGTGGDAGGSRKPGAGISDPSQIINPDAGDQQQSPVLGPGYQRGAGYRQLSK